MPSRRFVPSLRGASLAWLGLVLALVLIVFGATLYFRMRQALFSRVDADLVGRAHVLAASLENDIFSGWEFALDENYLDLVAAGGWFEVSASRGKFVRTGGVLPTHAAPTALGYADIGETREFIFAGPKDARVRVGQSVAAERAELQRLLVFTIVSGLGVLAAALAGGWWLTTRTLKPIARMSAAAEAISERDLSQRVDVAALPAELRDLAATLNAAFTRLDAAFTRQARFTADASHELRTPLSVIRAQAEHALRRERTSAEYRSAFEACLRSATRMSHVVEQLLTLARADATEMQVEHAEVDLRSVATEALREAGAAADSANVELSSTLESVIVRGDASLLHEVVANLVSNAIRYNKPGGHLRVSLEPRGDCALLSVADDGEGIPSAALPHIFERFYRVDQARSRERGGSGLGLAITRWIVEAHGGSVVVESRVGVGTVFSVTLPKQGPARLESAQAG